LLLIREFVFMGRREYGEFLQMMEGISTNILASRLKWLVDTGIFIKHQHPANRRKYYYEITSKGFDLVPVFMELGAWGLRHLPGTAMPDDIRSLYLHDRQKFMSHCRSTVEQKSKAYLQAAKD
ncbi:MAG: winged helix-turn-helix transcriptional regulator, partial [Oceanococcus sp.]